MYDYNYDYKLMNILDNYIITPIVVFIEYLTSSKKEEEKKNNSNSFSNSFYNSFNYFFSPPKTESIELDYIR